MAGAGAAESRRAVRPMLFLVVCFVLLFCNLEWNFFGIERAQIAEDLGVDAYIIPALHMYVTGPKLQADLGEIFTFYDPGHAEPYFMQVGLQRMVYTWLSPRSDAGIDAAVPYLRAGLTVLLALTLTGFLRFVQVEFGTLCAGITCVLLTLSDWLIVFAPLLFWASATLFLPFVLACLMGDPLRSKRDRRLLAVLFTLACLVKALCGFDYITNVFGAVAAPMLYYGLRRGVPLKKTGLRIAGYGALSVLAFAFAIVLQVLQYMVIEHSSTTSLRNFVTEVRRRTGTNGEGISTRYSDGVLTLLHHLHVSQRYDGTIAAHVQPLSPVLRYLRYLSMSAFTIPLPFHSLHVPIGLTVVGFLIALWLYRRNHAAAMGAGTSRVSALLWSTLLALLISHFWAVAANGHMTHTFFNAIIFYIPFLPMMYVVIALGIERGILGRRSSAP